MKTLGDAWDWYRKNRELLGLMGRLARRYWDDLPEPMSNDDHFREREGDEIEKSANSVLAELDDLAVFVMFSVFESIVRANLWEEVGAEVAAFEHPALIKLADRLRENIEEGSFYHNILDLYKSLDHDLIESVNQVRKYRNWVAHGRPMGRKTANVTPFEAFDRLSLFLTLIGHVEGPTIDEP